MMPFRLPVAQPLTVVLAAAVPTTLWIADGILMRRKLSVARRDPVTGLHGRAGFTHHATQVVRRYGDDSLVLFLDMVGFKAVNDGLGHDEGNQILIATGERLNEWAGQRGVAARIYGDEFAAARPLPRHRRDNRLTELYRALHRPVRIGEDLIHPGVSIGTASPSDLATRDLSSLLRGADVAMYEHKREKQGAYRMATVAHMEVHSENGRRPGRDGTGTPDTFAHAA